MENRAHLIQSDPDARAATFGDFCPQSGKQGFDVTPGDIGAFRLLKDGLERLLVFAVHANKIS